MLDVFKLVSVGLCGRYQSASVPPGNRVVLYYFNTEIKAEKGYLFAFSHPKDAYRYLCSFACATPCCCDKKDAEFVVLRCQAAKVFSAESLCIYRVPYLQQYDLLRFRGNQTEPTPDKVIDLFWENYTSGEDCGLHDDDDQYWTTLPGGTVLTEKLAPVEEVEYYQIVRHLPW